MAETRVTAEEFKKLSEEPDQPKGVPDQLSSGPEVPEYYENGKKIDPKVRALMQAASKIKLNNSQIKKKIMSAPPRKLDASDRSALNKEIRSLLKGTILSLPKYDLLERIILRADDLNEAQRLISESLSMLKSGKTVKQTADSLSVSLGVIRDEEDLKKAEATGNFIENPNPSYRPFYYPEEPWEWNPSSTQPPTKEEVHQILREWRRLKPTGEEGCVNFDKLNEEIGKFGNVLIDIPTLYQTGHFYYFDILDATVREIQEVLTPGFLRLVFIPHPNPSHYTQEDVVDYLAFAKGYNNMPYRTSAKYKDIKKMNIPNLDQEVDTLVTNNQYGNGVIVRPLDTPSGSREGRGKKAPKGTAESCRPGGPGKARSGKARNVIGESGEFGKVVVHPVALAGRRLYVLSQDGGKVLIDEPCGEGLLHVLTSPRMSAKMREKLTPKDVEQYQRVVQLANVRLSPDSQQRRIAELPIVTGTTPQELIHRLEVICGSISAGNRPNKLIKNEANAILNRLLEMGTISSEEALQIQKKYL